MIRIVYICYWWIHLPSGWFARSPFGACTTRCNTVSSQAVIFICWESVLDSWSRFILTEDKSSRTCSPNILEHYPQRPNVSDSQSVTRWLILSGGVAQKGPYVGVNSEADTVTRCDKIKQCQAMWFDASWANNPDKADWVILWYFENVWYLGCIQQHAMQAMYAMPCMRPVLLILW